VNEVADGVYRLGTRWANFYLVVEGAEGLLVDAGYPRYFKQLQRDNSTSANTANPRVRIDPERRSWSFVCPGSGWCGWRLPIGATENVKL
jgi:hypothetical protein